MLPVSRHDSISIAVRGLPPTSAGPKSTASAVSGATPGLHAPLRHASPTVHGSLSLHTESSGWVTSAGHWADEPVHASSISQPPGIAGRHTVPLGFRALLAGHVPLLLHVAATSHNPAASRQTLEVGSTASIG